MGNKTRMVSATVELAFYLDPARSKEVNKAEIVSNINKQIPEIRTWTSLVEQLDSLRTVTHLLPLET